jgi:Family of unknown function (DUF5329)
VIRRRCALLAGALALAVGRAAAVPPPAEVARIERLIRHVADQREVAFVRNGTPYPPGEAAQFLRAKFARMGEHVGSAVQFIEQIASRSSTTGQPYLIRFADGRTQPVAQFLGDELRRMDARP